MILDVIVEDKKKRLVEQKNAISEEAMKQEALNLKRQSISFYDALRKSGLSIIGEFKKASPSHGKEKLPVYGCSGYYFRTDEGTCQEARAGETV